MPAASPQSATASPERFARAGQIRLCYQTFGSPDARPLLLVMGLGAQMVLWDDDFCELLAERGFWVIRFDNRDIGRSTILHDAPVPSVLQLALRDRRAATYSLSDMAGDAAGLLDHLGVPAAHVAGVSMGGMIAQTLAIEHPERTRSLVSIMSTTGNRRVGQPHPRMYRRLLKRSRRDHDGYVEDFVSTHTAIGSRTYPRDPADLAAIGERCYERGVHPAGAARQLAAIIAAPDRTPRLRGLRVPTTVVHGDADHLVRPSGGRATAEAVPDARLVIVTGMAHDLPPQVWPQVTEAIAQNAAAAQDGR